VVTPLEAREDKEMETREELYRLVDALWSRLAWPGRFLRFLSNGGQEPLSAEDWQAVREGEAAIARGEFVTIDELKRELGL
jgi:hypothetical protein